MLGQLLEAGHTITSEASDADCVVVNTCGFIRPAADESIDAILEMVQWKKEAPGRRLVVAGCLPQRYGQDLVKALPEVDVFLGTGAFHRIQDAVENSTFETDALFPPPATGPVYGKDLPRLQTTPPHTAYLKIAEGCSGRCTYCIIPNLRGPQRSRPMEDVLFEAQDLVTAGAKELVLVAQNTTAYGHDLGRGYHLEDLLENLTGSPELAWIRVLYGHPDFITDRLIQTMADREKICSYFDIPIQHISEPVLKKMGRSSDSARLLRLFEQIRRVPNTALRTTLMVGFPGETGQDFERLLDLVETVRFDHMGAFVYSGDKDLPSDGLKDHVAENVKEERFERLMTRQAAISRENNQRFVGKTLQVLVEGPYPDSKNRDGGGVLTGRTAFQAPDIDGRVFLEGGSAIIGSFVEARVTEADEYDLTGDIL